MSLIDSAATMTPVQPITPMVLMMILDLFFSVLRAISLLLNLILFHKADMRSRKIWLPDFEGLPRSRTAGVSSSRRRQE